jgi:hypothetical protein
VTGPGLDEEVDPIDARRIAARIALFAALEAFGRAAGRAGVGALLRAYEEWACLGRDGE